MKFWTKLPPPSQPFITPPPSWTICTDATLQTWGAWETDKLWEPEDMSVAVNKTDLPPGAKGTWGYLQRSYLDQNNISLNELAALRIGIETYLPLFQERGRAVRIWIDNRSAFYAVMNGKSQSPAIMEELRLLHSVVSREKLVLHPLWIASAANPADFFSRIGLDNGSDWKLHPRLFQWIQRELRANSKIDLFASELNKQLPLFCADRPQPGTGYLGNAWDLSWSDKYLHCNPPFELLGRVLNEIIKQQPREIVIIFPLWEQQPWCHSLFERATAAVLFHSSPLAFLPGKKGSIEPLRNTNWRFAAAKIIDGGQTLPALGLPPLAARGQSRRLNVMIGRAPNKKWMTQQEIDIVIRGDA